MTQIECRHEWSENSLGEYVCDLCGTLCRDDLVRVMPRGGVERNWWEEYQLLLRRFKKLATAARACLDEVDENIKNDDWPVKYRAPFGSLTKLRQALPETYDEFKVRAKASSTVDERV